MDLMKDLKVGDTVYTKLSNHINETKVSRLGETVWRAIPTIEVENVYGLDWYLHGVLTNSINNKKTLFRTLKEAQQ